MRLFGFFDRRVRGFRVVELGGLGVLLVLILTVYLAKTGAGGKRADIDRIQQQIVDEQTQIRILRAEVATLEQPERLEALSAKYLGLQPISARREVTPEALQDVARVAVVDHKTLIANDPLTNPGSPDLAPGQAGVVPTRTIPASKPDAAKSAAGAPNVKLAQAGSAPPDAADRARPNPPSKAADEDSIDESGELAPSGANR